MLLYSYGKIPPYRKYVKVDLETMGEAEKGQEFLVVVKTTTIPAERASELAMQLKNGLMEKFNAKTHYIAVKDDEITMYITGSPFAWSLLIAWLPAILGLFGIAMLGIGIWNAVASVPSWVYATLIGGIFILYMSPYIVKMVSRK
jgi:hypothetical protein